MVPQSHVERVAERLENTLIGIFSNISGTRTTGSRNLIPDTDPVKRSQSKFNLMALGSNMSFAVIKKRKKKRALRQLEGKICSLEFLSFSADSVCKRPAI